VSIDGVAGGHVHFADEDAAAVYTTVTPKHPRMMSRRESDLTASSSEGNDAISEVLRALQAAPHLPRCAADEPLAANGASGVTKFADAADENAGQEPGHEVHAESKSGMAAGRSAPRSWSVARLASRLAAPWRHRTPATAALTSPPAAAPGTITAPAEDNEAKLEATLSRRRSWLRLHLTPTAGISALVGLWTAHAVLMVGLAGSIALAGADAVPAASPGQADACNLPLRVWAFGYALLALLTLSILAASVVLGPVRAALGRRRAVAAGGVPTSPAGTTSSIGVPGWLIAPAASYVAMSTALSAGTAVAVLAPGGGGASCAPGVYGDAVTAIVLSWSLVTLSVGVALATAAAYGYAKAAKAAKVAAGTLSSKATARASSKVAPEPIGASEQGAPAGHSNANTTMLRWLAARRARRAATPNVPGTAFGTGAPIIPIGAGNVIQARALGGRSTIAKRDGGMDIGLGLGGGESGCGPVELQPMGVQPSGSRGGCKDTAAAEPAPGTDTVALTGGCSPKAGPAPGPAAGTGVLATTRRTLSRAVSSLSGGVGVSVGSILGRQRRTASSLSARSARTAYSLASQTESELPERPPTALTNAGGPGADSEAFDELDLDGGASVGARTGGSHSVNTSGTGHDVWLDLGAASDANAQAVAGLSSGRTPGAVAANGEPPRLPPDAAAASLAAQRLLSASPVVPLCDVHGNDVEGTL
jgi:hypothetical protein